MGYDGTLKFDTSIDSSGFQAGLSKLSGLASSAIKATTAVIGGAASAVAGIGAAAIKVGSDFEAGMSKVQSISGASATEIQQLAEKAKEMGAKTKFSATESAEAFQYMAMAGWKTGDMLNSIEGIMNLAAASGEDLATTSDIVTDAMTAFGLAADGTTTIIKDGYTKEVSNATHFADVLANDVTAEIAVTCTCEPYKISVASSDEPWKWDTFNFLNGVIRNTSDITINASSSWQKVTLDGWVHNETLRIVSNAEMKVRYRNSTYTISVGENIMYDLILYKGTNDLYFQGKGKVTLIHRGGML